ncbi:MAG: tetratricopeptide repeat protein [Bacteroidetes bacterium]|nr:tetratricopeptide repeat protein [Bacteroidota bacterium]
MSIPEITHIVSLLEGGKVAEARPMLEQLLGEVPQHVSARVVLARLLESQSEFEKALQHWKWAAYYCPNNAVIEKGLSKAVLHQLFSGDGGVARREQPISGGAPVVDSQPIPSAPAPGHSSAPGHSPAPGHSAPAHSPTERKISPPGAPVLEYQDLDQLIQELEMARIVLDPDVRMIPQGELETEIDDVVSETLARIYANQKFHEEAAQVYEKLAIQRPDKAEEFLQKAQELRQKNVVKDR